MMGGYEDRYTSNIYHDRLVPRHSRLLLLDTCALMTMADYAMPLELLLFRSTYREDTITRFGSVTKVGRLCVHGRFASFRIS